MWLGVLLILGIDLVLVGLVCAIVFVATTGLGWWQDRRQARRFAETFTWERAADETATHLYRVLASRRPLP